MGGLLGPADGLYHDLGDRFAADGIATLRVSYRTPNDFGRCVHDALAAADIAARQGARRFVTMGHSFGGAVAVQLGMAMGDYTRGVVTLATQSAGCEDAEGLAETPMLLFHGDRDEILPPFASEVVHQLAGGHGELVDPPGRRTPAGRGRRPAPRPARRVDPGAAGRLGEPIRRRPAPTRASGPARSGRQPTSHRDRHRATAANTNGASGADLVGEDAADDAPRPWPHPRPASGWPLGPAEQPVRARCAGGR